ncbi:hypothetical protein ACJZ2D_011138 [Fusarium nematophilum]
MPFTCNHPDCHRVYARKEHLTRHQKQHEALPSFGCSECQASFSRSDTLRRHMRLHESPRPPSGRVEKACTPCSLAKVRCTGQRPRCQRCGDKHLACRWPDEETGDSRQTNEHGPKDVSSSSSGVFPGFSSVDGIVQSQLLKAYFDDFHPQWPFLHQQSLMSGTCDAILLNTILATSFWFHNTSNDARRAAMGTIADQVRRIQDQLSKLFEEAKQNGSCPSFDLLPRLQSLLLQAIMVTQTPDASMAESICIPCRLVKLFESLGAFDHARIASGVNKSWISAELYQRLSICAFKLDVVVHSTTATEPRLPPHLDPSKLRINVPLPLFMWNGPAANPVGRSGNDGEDEQDDGNDVLLVSNLCEKTRTTGNRMIIFPLQSFDQVLGKAILSWCLENRYSG